MEDLSHLFRGLEGTLLSGRYTDVNGEAWVELLDWFESLNQDVRYQLTPLGESGPHLFVAEEVLGNRFKISGGSEAMKVSWQLTAVRQDSFAKSNPIPVEVEVTRECGND